MHSFSFQDSAVPGENHSRRFLFSEPVKLLMRKNKEFPETALTSAMDKLGT